MPGKADITEKYKRLHDALSKNYYSGETDMTKAEFDAVHGGIWIGLEAELVAAGFLDNPTPPRDFGKDIDNLEVRLDTFLGEMTQ